MSVYRRRVGVKELEKMRAAIRRAVAAELPEDEPDCVRGWVYDTAIRVTAEHLGVPFTRAAKAEQEKGATS